VYQFQETMSKQPPTIEIKSPRKIAINAVSIFCHATHSAAVRSFP
jgi:hypothetical protein